MDPSNDELILMKDVSQVFKWLEMEEDLITALKATIGGKATSVRVWARIPARRSDSLAETMKITDGEDTRELSPLEEGQVGEVARIIQLVVLATGPSLASAAVEGAQQGGQGGAGLQGGLGEV